MHSADPALIRQIDAILPQTQCKQCGFDGCRPYAEAIAGGSADINQCPPGGMAGITELAALLGRTVIALNPEHGMEKPRELAVIDEARCIGCTLCIQACPTDAIVGAAKLMHTVITDECTGCALCLAPCPVDCIDMVVLQPVVSSRLALPERVHARKRYHFHQFRLARDAQERAARLAGRSAAKRAESTPPPDATTDPGITPEAAARAAKIQAMMARAQARLAGTAPDAASPEAEQPAAAEAPLDDAATRKQARIAAAMARATALRQPKSS
ncbi:Electron transport complex subunit RsxB [Andreprevotia sp. IGB-42]|uniref:RnfABCDGE type electron transport complex subunit B n=1 Tax=Andreprevotia sp. IGB-42 TaxID=2497473 RepID=UPI001356EA82|nr:RnfABCDGE type electron transport complex subunit B [Andreprevotia sp. IGB-42]KAF0811795.1 Electron transport complex subunit RsxB [Andreprevotia sp. IGB-42]